MADKTTLQGQALQDFIASLHDLWWEPKEWDEFESSQKTPNPHPSGIALETRRADLIARVRQYQFIPQTPHELERLYYFLADLGLYEAYTLLLENRQGSAFEIQKNITDDFDCAVWELKLNFCLIDALYNIKQRGKCGSCFRHVVIAKITALSEPQTRNQAWDIYNLWGRVSYWSMQLGDRELFERAEHETQTVRNRHQLTKPVLPDAVSIQIAKAGFAHHWKQDGELLHHINEAIAHMAQTDAPEGQWESLFAAILDISPVQIPLALKAHEENFADKENPPASSMTRAERQVLAARWQARAKAAQNQLDAAIEWARCGHFGLHRDSNYNVFGRDLLAWLVEANRMDEAAELALQSLFHNRRTVRDAAFELAWEQTNTDKNPQRRAVWTLALLWARQISEIANYAKETNRELKSTDSYLRRLEKIAASHPAFYMTRDYFRSMNACCLIDINRQKKHWPQLDASVLAAPAYASKKMVLMLWCSRFMTCDEKTIRKLPIPEACGGAECFAIAWQLEQATYRYCPKNYWQPHAGLRQELAQKYYETGWLRFAQFYCDDSAFTDGNRETYALLCNNLGNIYRRQKRFEIAIERFEQSAAAYAYAQPHANLMRCFHELKDWKNEIKAAERHWHAVQEHGYQGGNNYYNPARYAQQIAHALHQENRGADIQIWIERLNQWWQQRDGDKDEKKTCRGDYLNALAALLSFYSMSHPREAEPLLRAHLTEIEHLTKKHAGEKSHGACKRYAAATLLHCAHATDNRQTLQQAEYFFRLALASLDPSETAEIGFARSGLAECLA